jgi:dTDP-4-amino-4,6-dideoxygalactose transaminase
MFTPEDLGSGLYASKGPFRNNMQRSKRCVSDLALFGGSAAFCEPIYTGTPNIPNKNRFSERVDAALTRRQLSNKGPFVTELEAKIAHLLGVKHCVATCNGTIALEIAIRALELRGEVIVPSFTFIATAHALQWLGVTPVFADVDGVTHNLDPSHIAGMITPRTAGIIGVHLWGRPCDVEGLAQLADCHEIPILFDAAHAFACSSKGRMIGNFGSLEVFSFHATKFFHTFEGGAITTGDDDLANRLRALQNFGLAAPDKVLAVGTNGKMNEICAAMGLTCLEELDQFVAANYCNYKRYQRAMEDVPGIRLLAFDEHERCNYQYIVIEIDEEITRINRDEILLVLQLEKIIAKRYFHPGCHRTEPYRSLPSSGHIVLPQTEMLARRVLVLPNGTAVAPNDIDCICDIIRFTTVHGEKIRERLACWTDHSLPCDAQNR